MNPHRVAAIASMAVLAAACGPKDELTRVTADDVKVNAAIAEARATLPIFWSKLDSQDPGASAFHIKVGLPSAHGGVEHIWIDVLSHSELAVRGKLINEPTDLADLRLGSEITAETEKISDWSYEKAGKVYGAYTMRALLDRASPDIRRQAAAGLSSTPLEPEQH